MKTDFKGTGPMAEFVAESTNLFKALQNMRVIMPPGFSGSPPELKLESNEGGAVLKLIMNDAIMFREDHVFIESATISGGTLQGVDYRVENGKLIITVSIT